MSFTISEDYVEKARRKLKPTFEERLNLIDEQNVGLNLKWVIKQYQDRLLEQLRFIAPEQEFSANVNYQKNWENCFNLAEHFQNLYFFQVEQKTGIFFRKKRCRNLARLEFELKIIGAATQNFNLRLSLQDDFFLRVCEEELDALNFYFRGRKDFHLEGYHVYME
jgi:hypothetical protein